MTDEQKVTAWIDSKDCVYLGEGPEDVYRRAYGSSRLSVGFPQFIDILHSKGIRPVTLPPVNIAGTRDGVAQFELHIRGGLDRAADKD